jgi:hypothetical protein
MVEGLLNHLAGDPKPDGLAGPLFSDLEYEARKAIHVGVETLQNVAELVSRLESEFNRGFDFETELRGRPSRSKDVRDNT